MDAAVHRRQRLERVPVANRGDLGPRRAQVHARTGQDVLLRERGHHQFAVGAVRRLPAPAQQSARGRRCPDHGDHRHPHDPGAATGRGAHFGHVARRQVRLHGRSPGAHRRRHAGPGRRLDHAQAGRHHPAAGGAGHHRRSAAPRPGLQGQGAVRRVRARSGRAGAVPLRPGRRTRSWAASGTSTWAVSSTPSGPTRITNTSTR